MFTAQMATCSGEKFAELFNLDWLLVASFALLEVDCCGRGRSGPVVMCWRESRLALFSGIVRSGDILYKF